MAELCWPHVRIRINAVVAVLIRGMGLWTLNACRIVYVDDEAGPVTRFGFAYGTLAGHAQRGEERFSVIWRRDDDSVWYEILTYSRPNHLLMWLGYPIVRQAQRRFAVASLRAMQAEIESAKLTRQPWPAAAS